jgi:hypothetical protein
MSTAWRRVEYSAPHDRMMHLLSPPQLFALKIPAPVTKEGEAQMTGMRSADDIG